MGCFGFIDKAFIFIFLQIQWSHSARRGELALLAAGTNAIGLILYSHCSCATAELKTTSQPLSFHWSFHFIRFRNTNNKNTRDYRENAAVRYLVQPDTLEANFHVTDYSAWFALAKYIFTVKYLEEQWLWNIGLSLHG